MAVEAQVKLASQVGSGKVGNVGRDGNWGLGSSGIAGKVGGSNRQLIFTSKLLIAENVSRRKRRSKAKEL